MGLFDTVTVHDLVPPLTCADGHEITDFQTKDLECSMVGYFVYEGLLYRESGSHRIVEVPDGGGLLYGKHLGKDMHTGEILVYSSCNECKPVLYAGAPGSWHGLVEERLPWVEYQLRFGDGELRTSTMVKVESRQDVRSALLEHGIHVFNDDEYIAKRHFEKLT